MTKKEWTIIVALGVGTVVIFMCFGCLLLGILARSSAPTNPAVAEISNTATPEQPAPDIVELTDTPSPTHTPKPTDVPPPTPTRTKTPSPSQTPKPTQTIPPTKIPAPIVFTGKGDSVVNFNNPYPVAIAHITGNAESRFFAVTNYGSDGKQIDLLVNTTDPYDGVRPIDFRNDEHTTRFQVQSSGDWKIQILPLASARQLNVPGTIKGRGDDVLRLGGSTPDLAKINGNAGKRFFAVIGYSDSADLLVNTTSQYAGTVILDSSTLVMEVDATGDWTIEVTSK